MGKYTTWYVNPDNATEVIFGEDGEGADLYFTKPGGSALAAKNASRIVSCVNACRALPDPERDVPALISGLTVLIEMADEWYEGTAYTPDIEAARALLARINPEPGK